MILNLFGFQEYVNCEKFMKIAIENKNLDIIKFLIDDFGIESFSVDELLVWVELRMKKVRS